MFDIPLRRRIQRLWLTEALRNKELEGTVDDGDAMRRLVANAAMQDATDEQLILQRTESLASTNPLATLSARV
jgi:hypothetical protein